MKMLEGKNFRTAKYKNVVMLERADAIDKMASFHLKSFLSKVLIAGCLAFVGF